MTERKTKDWAKTSSDAFVGDTGEKGDRGERIAVGLLEKMGFLVSHHPKDKAIQCAGIDLFVSLDGTKWWPVQVKNNLHFGGDVCVDRKKLYTSQATWWLHINENMPNDFIIYPTAEMQHYLRNRTPQELHWVPRSIAGKMK